VGAAVVGFKFPLGRLFEVEDQGRPHAAPPVCTAPHTPHPTPNRCAAAIWLVSLLSYCTAAPALTDESRLGQLQGGFTALLGDTNELTQETAARGVSLVYSKGGAGLRAQLLAQLVGVLQVGVQGCACGWCRVVFGRAGGAGWWR